MTNLETLNLNPEEITPQMDELEKKKTTLRDFYAQSEDESFNAIANDDNFWNQISNENVDFLYNKALEIIENNKKISEIMAARERLREASIKEEEQESEKTSLFEAGKNILLATPQTYICVDIEADGIAGCGSMLSIGAISTNGERYYSEICPESDEYLDENRIFCENHGLKREVLLNSAPKATDVMKEFKEWVDTCVSKNDNKEPLFAAYNAAFDWSFVDLYFKKCGIENPFGIAPFDIKSQALQLSDNLDWRETKKSNLPQGIIPNDDFSHNAIDDAAYQQKLLFGITALLKQAHQQTDK